MKRTARVRAAAVIGVAALTLSACGGGDDTSEDTSGGGGGDDANASEPAPDGEETSAAPEAEAPSEDSTEPPVRDANADLVIWSDDVRAPAVQEFADQFGEENGVTVQVQVATDVRQQYTDATNVDQGPDVVVGAHDWLGEFVQNGAVAPVQLSADQQGLFSENAIAATQFEGQTYGVPYATESLGLIRNTALAPDEPATMEELVSTGNDMVEAGDADQPMIQQLGQQGDAYNAYPYLSAYGGGIFGMTDEGYDPSDLIVDSPETVEGGEKLAWLGEEGALSVNIGGENALALFTEGRTPYLVSGPWAIANLEGAGIEYEISPIPDFEDGGVTTPFLGVQMFYVSSKAKNAPIAQEFVLNYVSRPDFQEALYEAGDRTPALTEALDTVSADNPDIGAWAEAGADSPPMPNIPAMNAVWGPLGQASADIVDGDDPAERLGAAQTEIESALQ